MDRKNFAYWGAALVALAVIIGIGVNQWLGDRNPPASRTVADAVHEIANSTYGGTDGQTNSAPGIQDLLTALGVPGEVFANYSLGESPSNFAEREELRNVLGIAVSNGKLSAAEANAVLKAFDAGLVGPASGPLVLESLDY